MLFIFFVGFLAGTIILFTRAKKDESARWLVVCAYCASFGALSNSIVDDFIPGLQSAGMLNDWIYIFLYEFHIYSQLFGQIFAPYACLMYAIVFSDVTTSKNRIILAFSLSLPVVSTIPLSDLYPDIKVNFKYMLIWSTPYYFVATFLVLRSWYKESNKARKRSKLNVLLIVVPTWLGVYFFNNIPAAFDIDNQLFRLLPIVFGITYLLFFVSIFLSGVFGLKIKVEEQILDKSIQIMSSGTAVLNHTIKNEIHKIKFFYLIAKEEVEKSNFEEARKAIDSALPAIEHIENMVDRIKSKTEEIVLHESNHNLNEIVNSVIDSFEALCAVHGIKTEVNLGWIVDLECDEILLAEVMKNILNNAIEALNTSDRGVICVSLKKVKAEVHLEIRDNGIGIPEEEMGRVLEPFFSTKRNPKNHGLGLSFCYNVMKAHSSSLDISSEVGEGTAVTLRFAKKKIIASKELK